MNNQDKRCQHEVTGLLFSEFKTENGVHYGKCVYCGVWFDLAKVGMPNWTKVCVSI